MCYKALMASIFLLVSGVVAAEGAKEKGGYIGGAFGVTEFEDDGAFAGLKFDDNDTSIQLYGGWKFLKYFAVEGRLLDLGEYTVQSAKFDATAFTVNAVGILPFGSSPWELFGQLGIGSINLDISGGPDEDEPVGSAGIGIRVTPIEHFSVALQIDAYAWEDDSLGQTFDVSITTAQIAFQYNF